ncbi:heparan sulfate glucosamine 3-O-sulfotransferase 3A1 [Elysia marginata]|uniref:Heparan sulfate glucosamine 3-O-sulfotransferase 3A1 n=1 Tax=Elysia marginata TaxID=1093978 RepID=A0AAV4ILF9_9GAST|nr:heparan sulfate glucosamine 3-O-sulfotransferase 3A1 [Elysia marginata]
MFQDYHSTGEYSQRDTQDTKEPYIRRRLPKALIIGFSKCGTSALRSFLTIHPDIVAPGNEVRFFTDHYSKGLEWYRHQMPKSTANQITIEKTPGYIKTLETLDHIHEFNPKIKLLVIVRNPVTRLQSQYAHHMYKISVSRSNQSIVSFEKWLHLVPF